MTDVDNGRPAARVLALRPDGYRPGPIDLTVLDQTDWADLEVATVSESLPTLVRALVAARDNDGYWAYFLWEQVVGAIVHQGTCYPATAPMMPVLAELAISSGLTAVRRLDLLMALALTADQANIDAIYDSPTRIEQWAAEAHTAVGEALPRLLERWQHEPVAIQFVLAVLAGLYPGQRAVVANKVAGLARDLAGTQPGAYLDLAYALLTEDEAAAVTLARHILTWDDQIDPSLLDRPDLPAALVCGHLLRWGGLSIADNHE